MIGGVQRTDGHAYPNPVSGKHQPPQNKTAAVSLHVFSREQLLEAQRRQVDKEIFNPVTGADAHPNAVAELLNAYPNNWSCEEYQERVHRALLDLAKMKLIPYPDNCEIKFRPIRAQDSSENLEFYMEVWKVLILDPSLTTKFGVHYTLFCRAITLYGTEYHHEKYLSGATDLSVRGCFCMTELAHGSNVKALRTLAAYDKDTQEFVITTPDNLGLKWWIGNAGRYGNTGILFARLIIGDHDYGVHAFVVPLRGRDGNPMPGVQLGDCGEKLGLNGVDNGWIRFSGLRIPRVEMLDRYAEVAPDGTYRKKIQGSVFLKMLMTLTGGRIGVVVSNTQGAKSYIKIAYNDLKLPTEIITKIISQAYAFDCAEKYLIRNPTDHVLATAFKISTSDGLAETISTCMFYWTRTGPDMETIRRKVAVWNLMWQNKKDQDITRTYEGDNYVIAQAVAYDVLNRFQHPRLSDVLSTPSHFLKLANPSNDLVRRLAYRVVANAILIIRALYGKERGEIMKEWNRQQFKILDLSRDYTNLVLLDMLIQRSSTAELRMLSDVFGLHALSMDAPGDRARLTRLNRLLEPKLPRLVKELDVGRLPASLSAKL